MRLYDQLFCNGEIYTVDERCPTAEALAVKGGRIAAVGSLAECRAVLGKNFETVNLENGALLPGFIDTHLHPTLMIYFALSLTLEEVRSVAEMQETVREAAAQEKQSPWILGFKLDDQALEERRRVNRHDLDAACGSRPVVLVTLDGHRVITNTRALEEAGLTEKTADPPGGKIEREESGYPAGIFHEQAVNLILDRVPLPELEEIQEAAKSVFRELAASGITSIGAVLQTGAEGPAGKNGAFDLPLMEMLLDQIPLSIYSLIISREIEQVEAARQSGLHQETQDGASPGRKTGAVKIFCDGTLQAGTAYMAQPYTNQPGNSGFMIHEPEDLYGRMVAAHLAGLQIAIHAIGDAANRTCVDLYKRLLEKYPRRDHRHRLEHASVLNAGLIADLAGLELVVSSQPSFLHTEEHWLPEQIGPERCQWAYPYRSLVEAGIKLAGASDAPVCSPDVLQGLQCFVTREGFVAEQSLSAAQAVRAFTIDAAYAQFEEQIKGSLSVGKKADLVVLSANPVRAEPEHITEIRVKRTICGGITIFCEQDGRYA
jgi:predicted amidohydrolase YtcJ